MVSPESRARFQVTDWAAQGAWRLAKFRWTREIVAERKEAMRPVRLPEASDGYETMAEYWARMRRRREARQRQAKVMAGKLDALPRPMKPPARCADG